MKAVCETDHVAEATHAVLTPFGVYLLCTHHASEQTRAGQRVERLTPSLAAAASVEPE